MEDLDSFSATYIKSKEFNIKYSKLVRLLRLSNIKHWFNQQSEKRGIRVHLTKPHYSSQQCPCCGCIDKKNRPNQETFCCIDCGYEANADYNSSINLCCRFTEDVLQSKLHDFDEFSRLIPKNLGKLQIRKVLTEFYQSS